MITTALKKDIVRFQNSEITEYHIYKRLSKRIKNPQNRAVLLQIAHEEKEHAAFWETITQMPSRINTFKIWWYVFITRLFGLTFGIRLMEQGETDAQKTYENIVSQIPDAKYILQEEDKHEQQLINLLKEKKLNYIGSVVLGLNDALVELTGALAGLTFALQNTRLIAIVGLITGIAASFSMAASEYLSNRADGLNDKALTSSLSTGITYISTVVLLIAPYFIFSNHIVCLVATLSIAILIILVFNFYISVAKGYNFKKRFLEMAIISLGVSALSFGIGFVVRKTLGVSID